MTAKDRGEAEPGAVHVRVSGRVQGVGFRYHIVNRAAQLGLVGYARNMEDGAVEIRAEGSPEALEMLVDAARRGPRWARVDDVDVQPVAVSGRFREFGVKF